MSFDVNINFNFPQLGNIMALAPALQAVVDSFGAHIDSLKTSNDALVLAANQVLDALRALQAQPQGATAAELQAAIDPLQAKLDALAGADSAAAGTLVP